MNENTSEDTTKGLYEQYSNIALLIRSLRLESKNKAKTENALRLLKQQIDYVDVSHRACYSIADFFNKLCNIRGESLKNAFSEIKRLRSKIGFWKSFAFGAIFGIVAVIIIEIWRAI